jgi:hypothetical protein
MLRLLRLDSSEVTVHLPEWAADAATSDAISICRLANSSQARSLTVGKGLKCQRRRTLN